MRTAIKLLVAGASIGLVTCAVPPTPTPSSNVTIRADIAPAVATLPGLSGGPERRVGVLVEPDGRRTEFVEEEFILLPETQAALDAVLEAYSGTVLRAGAPATKPYLVHLDLTDAGFDDLGANLTTAGLQGPFTVSSDLAAKTAAVMAREGPEVMISINVVGRPTSIDEHPDGSGGFIDWETRPWMTEDDAPAAPGVQGLSIGVTHAWDYLRYKGVPEFAARSSIAIIDAGFALDTTSGFPLIGNQDFTRASDIRPLQVDLVDDDLTAGGKDTEDCNATSDCPWHGTRVFSIAGAVSGNEYGVAGISGNFASTVLLRTDYSMGLVIQAIYAAVDDFNVDVLNFSLGNSCGFGCHVSRFFGWGTSFGYQLAINHAANNGAIVVAAADNGIKDMASVDILPCELEPGICVGAIDSSAENQQAFGDAVDIWAPQGTLTTVTPATADLGVEDQLTSPGGTSSATPFVAGVVALMKALDEDLQTEEVRQILQQTANFSTADLSAGENVDRGWVDAFRAVASVSPNEPPVVRILWPRDGELYLQNSVTSTLARVTDPENDTTGLDFTDDVFFRLDDAPLCSSAGPLPSCPLDPLDPLTPGTHMITARATDPFGATRAESIEFSIVDLPPVARIDFPQPPDVSFATDQEVCFHGAGYDTDSAQPGTGVTLAWTLNANMLSNERHFCSSLPEGTHTIVLTVTDAFGQNATDSVDITVGPPAGLPSTQIVSPDAFHAFASGATVTFVGEGTDPEDGPLDDENLTWISDIDGVLGTGKTISFELTSPGNLANFDGFLAHTIRLVATDSDGNVAGTDLIVVLMGAIL